MTRYNTLDKVTCHHFWCLILDFREPSRRHVDAAQASASNFHLHDGAAPFARSAPKALKGLVEYLPASNGAVFSPPDGLADRGGRSPACRSESRRSANCARCRAAASPLHLTLLLLVSRPSANTFDHFRRHDSVAADVIELCVTRNQET